MPPGVPMSATSPVEGVVAPLSRHSQLNRYVDRALRYNSDVLIACERASNEYQAGLRRR